MRRLNGHELKALFVLSIVVPVGLLTTLRLTGILQEPKTITETTTLETVKWEFQRPNHYLAIDEILQVPYIGTELLATFTLIVIQYLENTTVIEDDWVHIAIMMNLTATNSNAFIRSLNVVFYEDYKLSAVYWLETNLNLTNLSTTSIEQGINGEDNLKAFISMDGIENPPISHLWAEAYWILGSPNNQNHRLEVIYESTYYNGTAYKKIILPFQLTIVGR